MTKGTHRLDEVMRALMARYHKNPEVGVTAQEVADCIDTTCGLSSQGVGAKLLEAVHSLKDIDYNHYLKPFGLEWSYAVDPTNTRKTYTGLGLKEESGRLLISTVQDDTTGSIAGLGIDDEIIAVNANRVQTSAGFAELIQRLANPSVELTCSCDGRQFTTILTPQVAKTARLKKIETATLEQNALLNYWLER